MLTGSFFWRSLGSTENFSGDALDGSLSVKSSPNHSSGLVQAASASSSARLTNVGISLFETTVLMPSSATSTPLNDSAYIVKRMIGTYGMTLQIAFAASIPFMIGMERSRMSKMSWSGKTRDSNLVLEAETAAGDFPACENTDVDVRASDGSTRVFSRGEEIERTGSHWEPQCPVGNTGSPKSIRMERPRGSGWANGMVETKTSTPVESPCLQVGS